MSRARSSVGQSRTRVRRHDRLSGHSHVGGQGASVVKAMQARWHHRACHHPTVQRSCFLKSWTLLTVHISRVLNKPAAVLFHIIIHCSVGYLHKPRPEWVVSCRFDLRQPPAARSLKTFLLCRRSSSGTATPRIDFWRSPSTREVRSQFARGATMIRKLKSGSTASTRARRTRRPANGATSARSSRARPPEARARRPVLQAALILQATLRGAEHDQGSRRQSNACGRTRPGCRIRASVARRIHGACRRHRLSVRSDHAHRAAMDDVPPDVIDMQRAENQHAANAATSRFDAAARLASVL